MTEWRLWDGDEPPFFTQREFFESHPHIPGDHQVGHSERINMVVGVIHTLMMTREWWTVSDIGCGDGSFLARLAGHARIVSLWGYDAGRGNLRRAETIGVIAREADIVVDDLSYGDITTITEVLEHLVDPDAMLRRITSEYLIATSPSAESNDWHYEHHAWAWDRDGYVALVERNGWKVFETYECEAERTVTFGPVVETKRPRFQCVVARRVQ